MIRYFLVAIFLFQLIQFTSAQTKINVKGIVYDFETKLPLANVNVFATHSNIGKISDAKGQFSFELPDNLSQPIILSHISYHPQTISINTKNDTTLYISLLKKDVELDEISILFDSRKQILNNELGKNEIKQTEIQSLPSLFGSADIMRSVINLPGISKGNEGDGGLYVRGGESGQNTVMLDDIEIINPTHVLGMYSVFNPFTTMKVSVYKGISPINYDRKLSSMIVVQSISNDTNRVKRTINLGNLLSDFGMNGTSKNKRISYNIGLRKSYLEAYSKLGSIILNKDKREYLQSNMLGFYDFNGKISIQSGQFSKHNFAWYFGKDYIHFDSDQANMKSSIGWQNSGIAYSFKQRIKENQTFETVFNYTNYRFAFEGTVIDKKMRFYTDYSHFKLKSYYQINKERTTSIFGFGASLYNLTPKNSTITSNLEEKTNFDVFKAFESSLFGSFEFKPHHNWTLNLGVKLKNFMFLGPYKYYGEDGDVLINYNNNQIIKTIIIPDFSFSSSLYLSSNSVWKSSYMFNSQNIHQGIVASIALPADLFVPTSRLIKPEYSHNFSSGITFNTLFNHDYSLTIDAYYKSMSNLLLYRINYNSAKTIQNIEDQFYSGIGWSTGIELSLVKSYGALTGNVSTSISKSRRKFDDFNQGKWFDSKYDRIGDISTTINYTLNPKLSASVNWLYTGGMKTTLSPGRYWLMGSIMNDYEGVNNVRLPAFHRLDIGLSVLLNSKLFEKSTLNFSIINVYNRKNPFLVNYGIEAPKDNPYALRIFATQLSLIPILPSISWKIEF